MSLKLSRRRLLRDAALLFAASAAPAMPALAAAPDALSILPRRPLRPIGGRDFARQVAGLSERARYAAAADQIVAGNFPGFLRRLTPVFLAGRDSGGPERVTLFVLPDYLSVGSRDDFLRVPLDLPAALRVAEQLGMSLPTPAMVDAIYAASSTTLAPAPLPPTEQMRSVAYALRHQELIEAARDGRPIAPLTAGHKKDLVITNRLYEQPGRVAIYGWHKLSGRPIQPLSLVHGAGYADYSHGVRLVGREILVDGAPMALRDALMDPAISPLLTREGTLDWPLA